jgi:hypothetical protein
MPKCRSWLVFEGISKAKAFLVPEVLAASWGVGKGRMYALLLPVGA